MSSKTQSLLFFCFLFFGTLIAQSEKSVSIIDFNLSRIQHQRRAMLVLGGWAVSNIALGASLRGNATGETRYFHDMNAYWNVVNLGIAGLGYFAALREDPSALDVYGTIQKHYAFQKILLFNAGLDIGYILGGLYLTERARRGGENADRLKGFGKSIMLQGGFLFAFDLVNYFISNTGSTQLHLILGGIAGPSLGLQLRF
ncbi:MAG: hypothetical protein AAFU67_08325 [Bacteroidota bacterium]